MQSSPTIAKISPALVKALGEIEGAAKTANNPHFRSKYANLEAVVDASRDVLAGHDLAVMQGAGQVSENRLHVTTRIIHASGEWIESEFQIPLAKVDPQATLAALTYARRGALMAMLGMPAVDDDGETAMGRGGPPTKTVDKPCPDLGIHPEGDDFYGCDGPGMTAHAAKKAGLDELHEISRQMIRATESHDALREWIKTNRDTIATMPRSWRVELRQTVGDHAATLGPATTDRRAA